MTAVKFCGLTRPVDADYAAALGAAYVGVIFAGGPRTLTPAEASKVMAAVPRGGPKRVGVFSGTAPNEIARSADQIPLDVVQLHVQPGAAGADEVAAVARCAARPLWAVLRCEEGRVPEHASKLAVYADALLIDAHVPGKLGGTGVALAWETLAEAVAAVRGTQPLVLAGGLTPDNVARAISALRPDVVDVSSGVERAPGVKDHGRMRAFMDAVNET